jgi:hypothetical protein
MSQQQTLAGSLFSEAASSSREGVTTRKLFGLVELDSAGTVLYTRFEPDGSQQFGGAADYTGRNFFTEVAPFRNVVEFRNQLDSFSRGSQAAYSIDFTCDYEDGPLPVRILLARIRECSRTDVTKSILVHIRKAK